MTAREKFAAAAKKQKNKRTREAKRQARPVSLKYELQPGEINLTEAVKRFNRTKAGLIKACKAGRLNSFKRGHARVFLVSEIEAYIASTEGYRTRNAYATLEKRKRAKA